jgi:hypothetical protein
VSGIGKAFDNMGKQISGLGKNKKAAKSKQQAKAKQYGSKAKKQELLKLASNAMKPYGTISAELDRIGKFIAKGPKRVTSFFKIRRSAPWRIRTRKSGLPVSV